MTSATREKYRRPIVGLPEGLLKKWQMQVGWKMARKRRFFEKYVWWWRPLCDILGPKHQDTEIPPDKLRGYFPPEMFTIIRHAEDMHKIPELLEEWIIQELDVRLAGTRYTEWPRFIPG